MLQRIIRTGNNKSLILVRMMAGAVFLSEGIQKFLFPALRGAGRFEKTGLPFPEILAPFTGSFEILCGALLLVGLVTRLAAVPLIIIITIALISTKMELLHTNGLWEMLHASRTDWSMLLACIFLLINGAGGWSADRKLMNTRDRFRR
jgi:putative oxidoreductase